MFTEPSVCVALMATFFVRNESLVNKGLRWGTLVIGAGAWVDIFATWWAARSDDGAIPYGEIPHFPVSTVTVRWSASPCVFGELGM